MGKRLDVSPTKGNLLQLRNQLSDARNRRDLLDRKREVLIRELMDRMDAAREIEQQMQELFRAAHDAMVVARMRTGRDAIQWASLSPTARVGVDVSIQTIMGLRIASLDIRLKPISPPYGLDYTSAALDEAREKWFDVIRFLGQAGELSNAVWRLASEVRKTQRQVNALDSTMIPRYQNTIRFIEGKLEEAEREDIVHAKKTKEMQKG